MTNPPCFTPEQWQAYREAAALDVTRCASYCRDCTPAYHAEMVEAKKCWHPKTTFRTICKGTPDEETIGVMDGKRARINTNGGE